MRLCWNYLACACAALLTGGVTASELSPLSTIRIEAGEELPISVRTNFDSVSGCYLITPEGDTIEFMPEDKSGDDFELRPPIVLFGCQVTIKNVSDNDNGIWELYYTTENGGRGSHFYDVTVVHKESELKDTGAHNSTENNSNETDNNDPIVEVEAETEKSTEANESDINLETVDLTAIEFGVRMGINVSLTLSKKDFVEECSLRTPKGQIVRFENSHTNIQGVETFAGSTYFVSCRVVIGPMPIDGSMLGNWTLCGRHSDSSGIYERCQPAVISWAINDPNADWESTTQTSFDHVVHFGGALSPVVRGRGSVNTCHVITPYGEDIPVTAESDYPGLERIENSRDPTACSIKISVIDGHFLGDWVLYGTFHSAFGFNVVSQPMHFYLYDQDNPHSQAYNITNLDPETHVVNLGNTIIVEVLGAGTRDDCLFETNSGEKYDVAFLNKNAVDGVSFVNQDNRVACRLRIGPITENMLGEWRLIGKFNNNNLFNELQLTFEIQQEDPSNPVVDPSREIQYLNAQVINAKFGDTHVVATGSGNFVTTQSCHIRTPENLQYTLMDGFSLRGVEIATGSGISCGVRIKLDNEDLIGEWMLIARLDIQGNRVERRLPFTINIEEIVAAVPDEIVIAEGNDLYLRLEKPTALFETCVLKAPAGSNATAERDSNFIDSCGFVVNDVSFEDSGPWEITYGRKMKYIATTAVTVIERNFVQEYDMTWAEFSSVNQTIGPEETVYCKIEAPNGFTVFEGFRRCNIIVDRVTRDHEGTWRMIIGTVGRVLTQTHEFVVRVTDLPARPKVMTSVETAKPAVMLSCKLEGDHTVTACKFRDPTGKILLASQGVGEDRYTFHGVGVSLQSNVTSHECGLRITNPVAEDMGLWRCAVETEEDVHFGFLTVLCPWAMNDPEIAAAVVSEPTLTADVSQMHVVEDEPVTLRCSIQAPIRYCYFRAQNGTVYNVNAGSYVGEGLEAGECGIRFPGLLATDSGRWSCHVGFHNPGVAEQRTPIYLQVIAWLRVHQFLEDNSRVLVVEGQVFDSRPLEYCRFVRIDGIGFTSENIPKEYEDHSILHSGLCKIRVKNPSVLDRHSWTVVARVRGHDEEIGRSTLDTLDAPPGPGEDILIVPPVRSTAFVIVWSCVLVVSLLLFFIGVMLGPKKNRQWTYRRASTLSNSLRKSFIKTPLAHSRPRVHATPTAA